MLTVMLILLLAAFVCTIANALGKCPIWVPVLIIVVALLLEALPLK